tara:strand:- start:1705 stop:2364 length:660 start_codon:yes stop_codon:yes gene_type:complete
MKKIAGFICILLCFSSFNGYSQAIDAGLKLGVAASQISGDDYSGFNKAGIIFGAFAKINLKERHHVQFEITYTQKGSRRNPKTSEGDTEFFLLRLDYIEVPLLYQYDYKSFTFETGPYIAALVNTHLEDENGVTTLPPELNQFKGFDVGVTAGISFNFNEHLIMSWRFSNSLVPVRDFESQERINNLQLGAGGLNRFNAGMFHSYISFSMHYKFGSKNG